MGFNRGYDGDLAFFDESGSPIERMEEEYGDNVFQNLLFGAFLGVLLLMLLSVCWNKCAGDELGSGGGSDASKDECRNMVIAREIKPGMMVIQGTNEETLRIIQEYEAIRMQVQQQPQQPFSYGSLVPGHIPVTMATSQYQQHSPPQQQSLVEGLPLIDLNNAPRPPPYAPAH